MNGGRARIQAKAGPCIWAIVVQVVCRPGREKAQKAKAAQRWGANERRQRVFLAKKGAQC